MSEQSIQLFTIGTGGKSAEQFFDILARAGVRRVIDVRLHNTSQLAGFTKSRDLAYFLRTILDAEYLHRPILAPTKEILNGYKKGLIDWPTYERRYRELLTQRQPQREFTPSVLDRACLLCAEPTAENCHRRLAAEFLRTAWPQTLITHL